MMVKKITASGKLEMVKTNGPQKKDVGAVVIKTDINKKSSLKKGDDVIRNGTRWIVVDAFETDNTKMIRIINTSNGDEEIMMLKSLLNEIN